MTARPGLTGEAALTVGEDDTALAVGSGDVPVLATPRLIVLCEVAALAALAPCLEEGETSVGVAVDVRHLAPTVVGRSVVAEARLDAVDGRRLTFVVRAVELGNGGGENDKEVARGRHVRVLVDRAQFLARAGVPDAPA